VTDVREMTAHVPPSLPAELRTHYTLALSAGFSSYQYLVDHGASLEDARGVLPLNTHCNLLAKYNLRAWVDLVRARESLRVQDEYREVIAAMKQCVTEVWPWASTFIEPKQAKAISIIEQVAINLPKEFQTLLAKAADLLKKEAA
jgi:thymidylate synthase ThyX